MVTTYEQFVDDPKSRPPPQAHAMTLVEHLESLLSHGDLVGSLPDKQVPGPRWTEGPTPVETLKLQFLERRPRYGGGIDFSPPDPVDVLVAASPEKLVGAPLMVRFGKLEVREEVVHGFHVKRIVTWTPAPLQMTP